MRRFLKKFVIRVPINEHLSFKCFFHAVFVTRRLGSAKTIAFIRRENMIGYLLADTICFKMPTVFQERRSSKLWSLRNKLCPTKNICTYFRANDRLLHLLSFKYFATRVKKKFANSILYAALAVFIFRVVCYNLMFLCNKQKTLFHLELNLRRRLIITEVKFENWGISLK